MYKKFNIYYFICILTITIVTSLISVSFLKYEAWGNETSASTSSFDFSKPIRVGYYTSFTSFANEIDSINNKGYGVEIFEKIEEVSDLEFEYIPIEGDGIEALQNGDVDLTAFHPKTDERAEKILYSQSQYSKTYVSLMTDDLDMLYADYEAIDGKTVATFEGNIANERFSSMAESLGFSFEYVYGQAHNYTELDTDFVLGYSEHRDIEELNNVLDVGVYNYFLNVTFENKELLDTIDVIFYDIVATEGNFFLELEEKYVAKNLEITHRGLMRSEIETLQSRPLEVGYIADYAPISFMNEDGFPDGSMVHTLNYFAERFDFEVNYHPYSLDDPLSEYSNYDLLLTLYGQDENIWDYYITTESYYVMPLFAQINNDLYENNYEEQQLTESNLKIGTLPYLTVDFTSFDEMYPEATFIFYDDWHQMLDNLAAGELDMLLSTESSLTYAEIYLENTDSVTLSANTEVHMQYLLNDNIADTYLSIINAMLDQISNTEYKTIIEASANDFLPDKELTFLQFAGKYWYYFVFFVFIVMIGFIALYYHDQIKKKEALIQSYNTEPLTGFLAPHTFRDAMANILKDAAPGEYELIVFDIDMFKNINTYFSAEKGTEVILAMADTMKKTFAGTDVKISRRTAEQFLILRRVNEGGTLQEIYEKGFLPNIKKVINDKFEATMSFGNVIIDDPEEKITTIIGHAYAARLAGKKTRKTTFITFDEKMKKEYNNKTSILFRIDEAFDSQEFVVEYQPKIDFATLKVSGAEALVRWKPKAEKMIYPNDFIPIFEDNGTIIHLDLYVLDKVCKYISENNENMDIPRISVNLSSHTILAENIVDKICEITTRYEINPEYIELELTESAVETDTPLFLDVVKQLKETGFSISIDDFGAGVSSLNRLSNIEADILKLDKAFFDFKERDTRNAAVISDVLSMAKHLNMEVVAEGVETATQAQWIKGMGCDYAQGYYFAKPMSETDFRNLLTDKKQFEIDVE